MAGGAQAKMSTWVSTPNQSLISKVTKKFGLIWFPRNCFRGLIFCDQEPLGLLNMMEDVCYFLGARVRLSTRCKLFHSKITEPFPQIHMNVPFKLTDLWITSLLFDLNYKFINRISSFSPGYILVL